MAQAPVPVGHGTCRPSFYNSDLYKLGRMTYVIGKPCVDVMDLPGRDGPLGSPGGAAKVGPVGADAPLVAGLPPQQ